MTDQKCFLCGEARPTRPHRVEVSTTYVSGGSTAHHDHEHGHHHHGSGSHRHATYELRPVCEPCIERDIATAKAMLKVGGAVMGGVSLLMLIGCAAPFVLMAVVGVVAFFMSR